MEMTADYPAQHAGAGQERQHQRRTPHFRLPGKRRESSGNKVVCIKKMGYNFIIRFTDRPEEHQESVLYQRNYSV